MWWGVEEQGHLNQRLVGWHPLNPNSGWHCGWVLFWKMLLALFVPALSVEGYIMHDVCVQALYVVQACALQGQDSQYDTQHPFWAGRLSKGREARHK